MKKIIGILLVVLAIILVYLGYNQISDSTASAEVLGVTISAADEGGQVQGYILLVIGVVSLIAGIFLLGRKD